MLTAYDLAWLRGLENKLSCLPSGASHADLGLDNVIVTGLEEGKCTAYVHVMSSMLSSSQCQHDLCVMSSQPRHATRM